MIYPLGKWWCSIVNWKRIPEGNMSIESHWFFHFAKSSINFATSQAVFQILEIKGSWNQRILWLHGYWLFNVGFITGISACDRCLETPAIKLENSGYTHFFLWKIQQRCGRDSILRAVLAFKSYRTWDGYLLLPLVGGLEHVFPMFFFIIPADFHILGVCH